MPSPTKANSTSAIELWMRLRAVMGRDPRKSLVLAVLLAVLLGMWGRMMLRGGQGPGAARANVATGSVGSDSTVSDAKSAYPSRPSASAAGAGSARGSKRSSAEAKLSDLDLPGGSATQAAGTQAASVRFREWLSEPVKPPTRNIFAVKLEYFPSDGSRPTQAVRTARDGEFWGKLEKSLTHQADQRDKRENLLANFRTEAGKLRLDSTIMGQQPKALIDGKLVAEGEVVAGFRVLKIEPRRIRVEREGIRLEIQMK
jgi:hypothetical protein